MRLGELAKVLRDQQTVNIISNEIFSVGWTFEANDIKNFTYYDSDFYNIEILNIFSRKNDSDISVMVDCVDDKLDNFVKNFNEFFTITKTHKN